MATTKRTLDAPASQGTTEAVDNRTLYERVDELYDQDRDAEAKQEIVNALAVDGEDDSALFLLALHEAYREDDYASAVMHFERSIELDPQSSAGPRTYIELVQSIHLLRHALDFLSGLPPEVTKLPSIRSSLGSLYSQAGWHALAFDAYGGWIGLSRDAMRSKLYSWIRRGGPIRPLRLWIKKLNNDSFRLWKTWSTNLGILDTLDYPQGLAAEIIRGRVDMYIQSWATSMTRWDAVKSSARLLVFAAMVLGGWSAAFELRSGMYSPRIVFASTATLIALLAWGLISAIGTASKRSQLIGRSIACALSVGGGFFLATALPSSSRLISALAYPLIIGGLGAAASMVSALAVEVTAGAKLNKIRESWPREAVIDYLLDVLKTLTSLEDKNDLSVRRGMIYKIEYAARRLERDLPKIFESSDSQTDEWLRTRAAGCAEALRHLKREIIVANAETWDRLAVLLRKEIGALATGDWAGLRWISPPPKAANVRSWWRIAIVVLRTVVVMAIPLIATFTLDPVLDLAPKTFGIAKIVSVAWAILYFLLTIDPTLQKKIETVRSVIGTIQESRSAPPPSQGASDKQKM
jgi:tetratricopeptide (TPR) repeat protein